MLDFRANVKAKAIEKLGEKKKFRNGDSNETRLSLLREQSKNCEIQLSEKKYSFYLKSFALSNTQNEIKIQKYIIMRAESGFYENDVQTMEGAE